MKIHLQNHLLCLLIAFCQLMYLNCNAQSKSDFQEAEEYFFYQEYDKALRIYEKFLNEEPDNSYWNYKVGQCNLYIPGKRDYAIPYLEKAVMNISGKAKDSRKEDQAPLIAHYLLGNSYREADRIDDAIESYEKYLELLDKKYDEIREYVELQIKHCNSAKELKKKPVCLVEEHQGAILNSSLDETNPVVAKDGNMMVFARKEGDKNEIFMASKNGSDWGDPVNISNQLKSTQYCYPSDISSDGKYLLIVEDDYFDANILFSKFDGNEWGSLMEYNKPLNTKYMESHASFSSDGKYIYFSSNREDGEGGFDIYRAQHLDGVIGEVSNMGNIINTPYNEDSPYLANDDNRLYFSSEGHTSMGGMDILYADKSASSWSEPVNLGYPINTSRDDLHFYPEKDSYNGYLCRFSRYGVGGRDIMKYNIFPESVKRQFTMTGSIMLEETEFPTGETIKVDILDVFNDTDTIDSFTLAKDQENYNKEITEGKYQVVFSCQGYEPVIKTVDIPHCYKEKEYALNASLNISEETRLLALQAEQEETDNPGNNITANTLASNNLQATNTTTSASTNTSGSSTNSSQSSSTTRENASSPAPGDYSYTIQIAARARPVPASYYHNLHVKKHAAYKGFTRYTTGNYNSQEMAKQELKRVRAMGYKDAFIRIAEWYNNPSTIQDVRIDPPSSSYTGGSSTNGYTIQLLARKTPMTDRSYFRNLTDITVSNGTDGFTRYTTGNYSSLGQANTELARLRNMGFDNAYVRTVRSIPNYGSN